MLLVTLICGIWMSMDLTNRTKTKAKSSPVVATSKADQGIFKVYYTVTYYTVSYCILIPLYM